MIYFNNVAQHIGHKKSEEIIKIEDNHFIKTQYCDDCNENFIVEKDINNWRIVTNFTCPKCGMTATESQKYIEKDGKIIDRHWKHCFNCGFTEEEDH